MDRALRCVLASRPPLERVPIKWNHLIDKDLLKINELEQVGIEKVEQLFLDMLSENNGNQRECTARFPLAMEICRRSCL